MDHSRSSCRKQEDDPAIMLFGKQIKGLSTKDKAEIKEELSPRGVDERGTLSFATSSDEEEDLNLSVEATCQDVMIEGSGQKAKRQWEKQKGNEEGECLAEKKKSKEGECPTIRMEGEKHAEKQKGGVWSRCPRCNSADTKFCYFNNYNVNQPRHFCKHCQRYWTAGGTLRNVPVGAGKRKNKHTLHKQSFLTNSICASDAAIQREAPLGFPDQGPIEKSDPNAVPTVKSEYPDAVPTRNSDGADAVSEVKPSAVNTNLELSAQHTFTYAPAPPSSPPCAIQSHWPTPTNTTPSHTPHNLIPLHQLHLDLQSRSSQLGPNLASGFSKLSRISPNWACETSAFSPDLACETSGFSTIYPELAGGCSKLSQLCPNLAGISSGLPGLSQIHPNLHSGSLGLSQISPGLQGGSSNLDKISPDLEGGTSRLGQTCPHWESGSSRLPHWESGSSRLGQACPHQGSGACSESSHECLTCRHNYGISGLAKSEGGHPILDQKRASLENGLPDLAKMNPSGNQGLRVMDKVNLQKKESYLQLGCSSGSKKGEAHKRGEGNGLIEMKATPMWDAKFSSCDTSSLTSVCKSEAAFNGNRGLGQGPPLLEASHNSLPTWAGLWPYFYNMYLMDGVAPHLRPILTPQGWALPFIPPSAPNVEPTSNGHFPPPPPPPPPRATITPTTFMLENFDSTHGRIPLTSDTTSTPTTSSTPTTPRLGTPNPYIACTPTTTLLSISKDISSGAFHVPISLLGKRLAQHASREDHEGFYGNSAKSSKE